MNSTANSSDRSVEIMQGLYGGIEGSHKVSTQGQYTSEHFLREVLKLRMGNVDLRDELYCQLFR